MTKIKYLFASARLQEMHLAGLFLCLGIIIIPAINVLLYPLVEGSWQVLLFYTLVSLVEIIFIFIFLMERRRRKYPVNHLPIGLWVAFIIWAAVALFNIPNMPLQAGGMLVTILFFIHFFFFVALSGYLARQPEAAQKLIIAIILSTILFLPLFWLAVQAFYDQPVFNWAWSLPGFLNVRHLDYYLGSLVVILGLIPLKIAYKDCSKVSVYLFFLVLLAFWTMLFWSGGRGSSIAAASSIGLVLLFFRPEGWKQLALFSLGALVVGALLSLLLPIPNVSYGIFRFVTQVDGMETFTAGRSLIWAEAFGIWKQNLWFGIGAGQTKAVIVAASDMLGQPHNIFIQVMMAWGIVGGVPFLAGIFGIFWTKGKEFFHGVEQNNRIVYVTYGLALSTSINALVDGALYSPFPVFLFAIAVSVTGMKNANPDNQDQYQPQGQIG